MASLPAHRRGTTGRPWRRFHASILTTATVCCICNGRRGGFVRNATCTHPTHQGLRGCPTHPLAPSLEHHQPLSLGGAVRSRHNAGAAHFSCNSSRGNGTKRSHTTKPARQTWAW